MTKPLTSPRALADTDISSDLGFDGNVLALALQPDGKLLVGGDFTSANGMPRNRIARLNPDYSLDIGFSSVSPTAGANDSVLAIAPQSDQRIVLGGNFTTMNGVNRNYLARITPAGFIDSTFNPGSGPDNTVFAIAETFVGSERKLLIGGAFTTFNSLQNPSYPFFARLNDNGSLDSTFAPHPNNKVFAITVQADGKMLIGGDFTSINGVARHHIARLNADGSLDLAFDPGTGPNDSVRAITIQLDGKILIGGLFTNVTDVTGQSFSRNHIARLDTLGHVDTSFSPGLGANDLVSSISLQADTRIVLGGQFTLCNGVTRNRLTRLNPDGSADTMINFGTGANSFIAATLVQPDGKIVFGGGFTQYDGQPAAHLARIYGGSIVGSGSFEFTAAEYQVDEVGTNALITVRRRGGTSNASSGTNVLVNFATSNGTAVAGSNYLAVSATLAFPPGEVLQSVLVPVMRDFAITPDLTVDLALSNPQPSGPGVTNGPALGNQATAVLTILNDDGAISFSDRQLSLPRRHPFGRRPHLCRPLRQHPAPRLRRSSRPPPAPPSPASTTNRSTTTLTFAPNQASNFVAVPLLYDTNAQGNTTVTLQLTNAFNALLFSPSSAILTIIDVDRLPGQLFFAQTNLFVSEGAGFANLTVLRTNGHFGIVTVNYATFPISASPGTNYITTNNILSFADGETNKTISVPILQEDDIEPGGSSAFTVALFNPGSGASILDPTNATVTILDDDVGLAILQPHLQCQ